MKTTERLHSFISMIRYSPGGIIAIVMIISFFLGCHDVDIKSHDGRSKFVLLIHNNNEPASMQRQFKKEYQEWIKTLGPEHNAAWMNLFDNGWVIEPGPGGLHVDPRSEFPGNGDVGSYFIFEAKNSDEALEIAKTCPHLLLARGALELRQIH